jgi:hypothetical protein
VFRCGDRLYQKGAMWQPPPFKKRTPPAIQFSILHYDCIGNTQGANPR